MENRNIYKMDDILIIGSYLMLAPAVYFALPWLTGLLDADDIIAHALSAPELLGRNFNMVILYFSGSLIAQFLGRSIRAKEKKTLEILDILLYKKTLTIDQLSQELGRSKPKVKSMAHKLASIKSLNIHLEGDTLSIGSAQVPHGGFSSPPRESLYETGKVTDHPKERSTSVNDQLEEKLPQELKNFLHSNNIDLSEKLERFKQVSQSDGVTPPPSPKGNKSSPSPLKKLPIPLPILLILFMTPIWPVVIIVVGVIAYKQYKSVDKPADGVNPPQSE